MVISEIPTPYRVPFFAQLAARPEIELDILFCARSEPDRPWQIDAALDALPHRVLRGFAPSIRTRRNTFVYQLNPGVLPLLARSRPDAIVVGGYSVFAEQVAIAIARLRGIPYLLHSESTLASPRPAHIRLAKRALVAPIVRSSAAGLATGTEAARYLERYGLPRERIRIVPNTIDVAAYGRDARVARARNAALRSSRGLPDRFVLFAGRLVEDKGVHDLIEAQRLLGSDGDPLLVAGEGPLARELRALPGVHVLGFLQTDRLIELYALAQWTVVPSRREPWGVVVNEALACGCPVIVTDVVGSGVDLVLDGVNGRVVQAGAPAALAAALTGPQPSGDPSKGPIEGWTHEFAVEQFLEAVTLALER